MITIWDKPVLASIEDIVKQLQLEIRGSGSELLRDVKPLGRNIMVTCPFHGDGTERKPSLGISTIETREDKRVYSAGTCHCFTCGHASDLPTFVSALYNKNDGGMEGYKWITTRFASVEIEMRKPLELDMSRKQNSASEISYVPESELETYRLIHDYMYHRKLNDKVIDYFDIGYDGKTDSITFPVHDLKGRVLFIQRRAVGRKQFLNESVVSKGSVVYGLHHVYKNLSWANEVMICESIIDALTCWVHRVPAVAIMGALPTRQQLELLEQCPVRKYIVGLDNPLTDKAGREGTTRIADTLGRKKLVSFLKFPDDVKDINEMTDEQFNDREIVQHRYFDN